MPNTNHPRRLQTNPLSSYQAQFVYKSAFKLHSPSAIFADFKLQANVCIVVFVHKRWLLLVLLAPFLGCSPGQQVEVGEPSTTSLLSWGRFAQVLPRPCRKWASQQPTGGARSQPS